MKESGARAILAPARQSGDHRAVEPFTDPPLMQRLLLEQPWPAAIALLAVAVGLTMAGRRRKQRGLRLVAWVLAILAGGIVGLAWQVQTPREHIIDRTHQLLAATEAPLDMDSLDNWLEPGAVVTGPDGSVWMQREQIDQRLQWIDRRRAVDAHEIRRLEAMADRSGYGRVGLELGTSLQRASRYGPIRTTWQLHWRRDDNGQWRVYEIECVSLHGRDPDRYMHRLRPRGF